MKRTAFTLLLSTLLAGPAFAGPATVAKENVKLFDELVSCSKSPDFQTHGLGQNGPCKGWIAKAEKQQSKDGELMSGGHFCLGGDILMAGQSLVSGDREHFNFVRESVEECRAAVE